MDPSRKQRMIESLMNDGLLKEDAEQIATFFLTERKDLVSDIAKIARALTKYCQTRGIFPRS